MEMFNWEFILFSLPLYQKAAWLTLKLSFWGITFSLVLGLACSIIHYYKLNILRQITTAYIELSRNTPLLIQLFFLYYGLTKIGLVMSEETCAIVGLAFLGGSYMAESFRAGLETVSRSQFESALSLGLSRWQIIRYIVFPQSLASALPSLSANCIFLIKETSIVGAIALPELMHITQDLIGMYYHTFESLALLVFTYLVLLLPISLMLSWLERKVRYAEFGPSDSH